MAGRAVSRDAEVVTARAEASHPPRPRAGPLELHSGDRSRRSGGPAMTLSLPRLPCSRVLLCPARSGPGPAADVDRRPHQRAGGEHAAAVARRPAGGVRAGRRRLEGQQAHQPPVAGRASMAAIRRSSPRAPTANRSRAGRPTASGSPSSPSAAAPRPHRFTCCRWRAAKPSR